MSVPVSLLGSGPIPDAQLLDRHRWVTTHNVRVAIQIIGDEVNDMVLLDLFNQFHRLHSSVVPNEPECVSDMLKC